MQNYFFLARLVCFLLTSPLILYPALRLYVLFLVLLYSVNVQHIVSVIASDEKNF